jgi:hypothetical protein
MEKRSVGPDVRAPANRKSRRQDQQRLRACSAQRSCSFRAIAVSRPVSVHAAAHRCDLLAATRYAVMMLRYARTEAQWRKFNGPLVMPRLSIA